MPPKKLQTLTDEALLGLLREDNRLAFNELYFRHWETMYRSAYLVLRDEHAAKDVLQNIFISIWKKRANLIVKNLPAYLHQSVKYQVANHLRSNPFKPIHLEKISSLFYENTTEEAINLKDLDSHIHNILDQLPSKCKQVFYLSRFEYLSNSEIAEKLEISQRTVEGHISKAIKKIKLSLGNLSV